MSPNYRFSRRNVLRGMMGGAAITVGLPFLDCFLNENGTALASGAALPLCFGSWFAGLGFNPGRWEPKIVGPNYDTNVEVQSLQPFRKKINFYSGMKAHLDSHPNIVHQTGSQVCLHGTAAGSQQELPPSLDTIVADAVGSRTRFRSLEVSCDGTPTSFSRRSANVVNPSEISPAALYTRVFGPEFQDPNSANFTPDPKVIARRSALSAVTEGRQSLASKLGAADRIRLDQYFSSLRELEQQLEIQLQKPVPLQACSTPAKPEELIHDTEIGDALSNHKLFAAILGHALACGQTQVFNVAFSQAVSQLRKAGSGTTMHIHSHEEKIDPELHYQLELSALQMQCAEGYRDMVATLDAIPEGSGTLLDRCVVMYSSDTGLANIHGLENMPLITAGSAGGRLKTGIHIQAQGDTASRVGLTVQQAMGMPVSTWGTESNQTSKAFTEVLA